MSFFKKLADDFDGLGLGDKKRDDERYSSSPDPSRQLLGNRDYPPPQQHYGSGPSHDYPSSYHQPPPSSDYHSSCGGPSSYGAPPPPSSSQAPSYSPPTDKPRIPDGWTPQWDQPYERWYYVEQATGKAQWEAPGHSAQDDSRGVGGHDTYGGGSAGYGGQQAYGQQGYGGGGEVYSEKKSANSGMLLGVAGGLATGAVGGALLHEALEDSDDEHRAAAPVYDQSYDQSYAQPPPVLPTHDVYGDDVSSSDRESVQEAREDYEEALADAQDSDASSSDQEELEEAREEYQEEYEETYYDD